MTPEEIEILRQLREIDPQYRDFYDPEVFDIINRLRGKEGSPPLRPKILECLQCDQRFPSWDKTINRLCITCRDETEYPVPDTEIRAYPGYKPSISAKLNKYDLVIGLRPNWSLNDEFNTQNLSEDPDYEYFCNLKEQYHDDWD